MATGGRNDGNGAAQQVTALVGRGRELAEVRAALRDRHPVVITGAAGTGRTALMRAALHTRAAARGGGLAALTGRPYAALEWALEAPAPAAAVDLRPSRSQGHRDNCSPGGDGPPRTGGGGSPGDGGVGRVDEVVAWVTGRLAGRSLAVDDLHLAHPATLAVLTELAGRVPLVVTLATDHPAAPEPARQVGAWPHVRMVEVGPLAGEPAARLVRRLAPGLGEHVAVRVADGSGGMPGSLVAAAAVAAAAAAERPAPVQTAIGSTAATLTTREAQVLTLVAAGAKTAQIAARLGIAGSTVESHVRAIRTKLGVPTRTAAVAWAS